MRFFAKKKTYLYISVAAVVVIIAVIAICIGLSNANKPVKQQVAKVEPVNTPPIVRETVKPSNTPAVRNTATPKPTPQPTPKPTPPNQEDQEIDYQYTSDDDYQYIVNDNEVTITKYTGSKTTVVIPSEIDGMKVISIGGRQGVDGYYGQRYSSWGEKGVIGVFTECAGLTDVTIPEGITYIGYAAFSGCSKLANITIPNSVTYIGDWAFADCKSLTDITIPDGVTYIGQTGETRFDSEMGQAFARCTGLVSVTIPESLTSIAISAFEGCTGLTDIIIPDSVTEISGWAFFGCTGLTSITIPESVTSIGDWVFCNCTGLTNITIPDSVTHIYDGAFSGCTGLTDITIPKGITHMGYRPFYGCKGLVNITFPKEFDYIRYGNSFSDTAWYNDFPNDFVIANQILIGYKGRESSVVIPDGVTAIADSAFEDYKSLTNVTIPDSVTHIGERAFAYTNLKNAILPDNVEIKAVAFSGTPWSKTEDYINRIGRLEEDWDVEEIRTEIYYGDYLPFSKSNKVVKADFSPTFSIADNYPRLDGATAFYPIYSAVTETVFKGLNEQSAQDYVVCNTTIQSYDRLINGETDIVFCLEPSQAQLAEANKKGVKLVLTPISKEAFVFFVNADNPINNLTTNQIQDIYSKKITNWKELGGKDETIMPFQRAENSGSQTIMQSFMQDKTLVQPLIEESILGMGGILHQVAEYRNYGNSIGYSFRFYATAMNPNAKIKLLSVNGIEPTAANIANGSYPLVYDIYAVTTEKTAKKENVKLLIDWILSGEGQRLIELCGYTAIK